MNNSDDRLELIKSSAGLTWELPASLKEKSLAKFFKQDPSLENLNRQYLAWRPLFERAAGKVTKPNQPGFYREGRYTVYAIWYPKHGEASNILVLVANDGVQTFNIILYKHPGTQQLSFFNFKEGQKPGLDLRQYSNEFLRQQLAKK